MRSKATLTVRMQHEDDYGMNEDSNLSRSGPSATVCVHLNKEDCQGTMTPTDNKRLTTKNEGSSMHDESCIGINYVHRTLTDFPSVSCHFTLC